MLGFLGFIMNISNSFDRRIFKCNAKQKEHYLDLGKKSSDGLDTRHFVRQKPKHQFYPKGGLLEDFSCVEKTPSRALGRHPATL